MIQPYQSLYLLDNIPSYLVESVGNGPAAPLPFHARQLLFQVIETPAEVPVGSILRHMGQRMLVTENGLVPLGYYMPAADPANFKPTTGV